MKKETLKDTIRKAQENELNRLQVKIDNLNPIKETEKAVCVKVELAYNNKNDDAYEKNLWIPKSCLTSVTKLKWFLDKMACEINYNCSYSII